MPHVLYIQSADFCCFLIHSPGYGSKLLIPAGWLNILNNLHLDLFLDPHLVWKNSHFQQPNRFKCLVADRPSLRWRFPAPVLLREEFHRGPCDTWKKNEVSFVFAATLDDFSWFLEDCLFGLIFSWEENCSNDKKHASNESKWCNHDSSWFRWLAGCIQAKQSESSKFQCLVQEVSLCVNYLYSMKILYIYILLYHSEILQIP